MKKLILIVLFLGSINIFAGNVWSDKVWFKYFNGKVGQNDAVLMLERYDSTLTGYIYSVADKQPHRIIGSIKNDSITLYVYTVNSNFADFTGTWKDGIYKGRCEPEESGIKTDFEFKVEPSISDYFDFEHTGGKKSLFNDLKRSPTASYQEGCVWPGEKLSGYEYLRTVIAAQKKFPANYRSVSTVLKNNMEDYFRNYFKDFKDVTKKEVQENDIWVSTYSSEEEDNLVPAYFDNNICVISQMVYVYTGGAHGNYGTGYTTVDLKNKKIPKLEDLVSTEGISNMPKLLEKYFRKQFEVSDTSSLVEAGLFTDTIGVNDNFCLTPTCLMFCYTPYEIGPYALGEVSIFIPIADLENYLSAEAKSMIR